MLVIANAKNLILNQFMQSLNKIFSDSLTSKIKFSSLTRKLMFEYKLILFPKA
jgi:hypothetical protein